MLTALPPEWLVEPPLDAGRFTLWLVGTIVILGVLIAVGTAFTRDTDADRKREAAEKRHLEKLLEADRREADLVRRRAEADAGRIDEITTELR